MTTIAESWAELAQRLRGTPEKIYDAKLTFYAGVGRGLRLSAECIRDGKLSAEDIRRLQDLNDEMAAHVREERTYGRLNWPPPTKTGG